MIRRGIWIAVLLALAFGSGCDTKPKSEQLFEQYAAHLKTLDESRWRAEPAYGDDYNDKADKLLNAARKAAIKEKNAPLAKILIEMTIEKLGRPQHRYGMTFPVGAAHLRLQAAYYQQLAMVHSWSNDQQAEQSALKKSAELESRAKKMERKK